MTKLIIGKNSSLVKKLRVDLSDFHFISHLDIDNINFNLYSEVYIFSFNRNSVEKNIRFINKILHKNIFYISTVAVFSIGYSGEYYKYPKIKNEIEKYCFNNGIKVIRIGCFENAKYFKKTVAVTTLKMIVSYFGDIQKLDLKNLFYIDPYKEDILSILYEKIFQILGHRKLLSLLLALISKICQKKLYGYSYAANSCLKKHIQIGYGALGSRLIPNDITHIVVSNDKNLILNKNGFNGFLVGKKKQGLGKLWHGVYTMTSEFDNKLIKKNILRKDKLYKSENYRLEIFPTSFIEFEDKFWILNSKNSRKKLITEKLTLAAGPIENLRLLSCIEKIEAKFNDDEVFFAGTINSNEPKLTDILDCDGLLIKQKYLLHHKLQDGYLLIDVRPFVPYSDSLLDQNFYNSSNIQIIYKLLTKFNFYRINEALYNLYGFGIKTQKLSIYCQYSKINSINFYADKGKIFNLTKCRATTDEINEIYRTLLNLFYSFKSMGGQIRTVDGQHISGGEEILHTKKMQNYIKTSKLRIIGIPSKKFKDALHTTVRLFPDEL